MDPLFRDRVLRASLKQQTEAAIRHVMVGIASSDLVLLTVVAAGQQDFRLRFVREFRHLAVDESIANSVYNFFCLKVADKWPGLTAGQVLDRWETVSPPTQAEIDRAWTFDESKSSPEGKREFYKDAAEPPIILTTPDPPAYPVVDGTPSKLVH